MSQKRIYPKKIITDYITHVSQNITVEKGFLFGSWARGDARSYSDVDLIIVSPAFQKMDFMERLQLLSRLREGAARTIAMDIIGYTPKEFEEMDRYSPNLAQIKHDGKTIYSG